MNDNDISGLKISMAKRNGTALYFRAGDDAPLKVTRIDKLPAASAEQAENQLEVAYLQNGTFVPLWLAEPSQFVELTTSVVEKDQKSEAVYKEIVTELVKELKSIVSSTRPDENAHRVAQATLGDILSMVGTPDKESVLYPLYAEIAL